MSKVQKILVNSYATLVMAERMEIEDVPETKIISGMDLPIRSEVEIEIARRAVEAIG